MVWIEIYHHCVSARVILNAKPELASVSVMGKRKILPPGLVEQQQVKKRRDPNTRYDAGKQFLTNLIYMIPLNQVLSRIIPFYWNPGKTILDVTAGKKISWETFPYNTEMFDGNIAWDVEFNDLNPEREADYHIPAQEVNTIGKHYDILFNDFPFTALKNGLESFGTKDNRGRAIGSRNQNYTRHFYFDGYRPLDQLFPECVESWNKTADNLIIKIGDSHKDYELIPNHFYAIKAFDKRENPKSQFHLMDCIHYRGIYSSRGGRFPFAQSVISYYLIFKKDLKKR